MHFVIVGGGSSGWIAATTLLGAPHSKITLIESPKTPTIGVGESTIDGFIDWMNLVGIKPEDIMKDTDASFKLAIKFEDFAHKGHQSFYPFGTSALDKKKYETWAKRKFIDPDRHKSLEDTFFAAMALVREGKFRKDTEYYRHNGFALHFDAAKFGKWLWENYCKPRGVELIRQEVVNIDVNDDGINFLKLDNGDVIKGDMYIDCTGFKSLLLEGALKVPFKDYSNVIPNNMAWSTHLPYIDKEKELVGYTNCTAINNGWVWNIPLWSRIGSGYVYSNKFITDDQALDEFKEYIRKNGRDPETLQYKKIPIKNGIHEKIWHKNVVAIGLAAGFIEPLESTGLWFTHEFAYMFLRLLYRGLPIGQFDQDLFNKSCHSQWEETVEFVGMHYALSKRRDSEYWIDVAKRNYHMSDLFVSCTFNKIRWHSNWPGINCIVHGWGHDFYDETNFWMNVFPKNANFKEMYKSEFDMLEMTPSRWYAEVKTAPKLIDVLHAIHEEQVPAASPLC